MSNLRLGLAARFLVPVIILVACVGLLTTSRGPDQRTVSAEFPEAVAVYEGTEVRVLGVPVGRVTRITPAGESVRVDMEYDADVKLPGNVSALVVTPTLVADRFIQLTPAYNGGAVFADGGVIPREDSGVPVELDRIYQGVSDLVTALGPNGLNEDGTLNEVLRSSARAINGKGYLANRTVKELAAAADTIGDSSGDLFGTLEQLAKVTDTLAHNDQVVRAFLADLAVISSYLADERDELERAVAATANAIGTVGNFVADNRAAVRQTIQRLTKVLETVSAERESLGDALRTGPVALGNLTVAFNNKTSTIGSRISIQNNIADADGVLCALVQQGDMPAATKDLACRIFEQLEPVNQAIYEGSTSSSGPGAPSPSTRPTSGEPSLEMLMGGAR